MTSTIEEATLVLPDRFRDAMRRFAAKSDDKFDGIEWFADADAPRLAGCHAWVALDTRQIIPGGDHMVVFGEVVDAEACAGHLPLTYHDRTFGTHIEL